MPDSDRDWRKWGREDPYFGVLASPEFARDRIAANRAAFFESGEQFVAALLAGRREPLRRALDHGCGTGRLTLPFARRAGEVVALDVSPDMLAEAARNADEAGLNNVRFEQADDALSRATGQFDLVNSHLVLQHVPVRRGLRVFSGLLDRLAPGGLFHISVSIRNDTGPWRWLYWSSANVPGVKIVQNLLRGARWNAPAMQMNDYPLGTLMAELTKRGVCQVSVTLDAYHPRFQTVSLQGVRPAA